MADIFYNQIIARLSGGGGVYDLAAPANLTVGGIDNGEDLTGLTWQQVIERLTVTYLSPAFTSATMTGTGTFEVGTALSSTRTFTWAISNPSNVQPNSVVIRDVTNAVNVATGLANDGTETVNVGVIANTSPITQQYRIQATNTLSAVFQSALLTINTIYPYFYGVSNTAPTADQALIDSGTKVVGSSTGTINVTFGAVNQYLWFAIPQSSADKTKWYVDAINQGNIGTPTDLFNNDVIVPINSPTGLWTGVNYRIYLSNYATSTTGVMELRNS